MVGSIPQGVSQRFYQESKDLPRNQVETKDINPKTTRMIFFNEYFARKNLRLHEKQLSNK